MTMMAETAMRVQLMVAPMVALQIVKTVYMIGLHTDLSAAIQRGTSLELTVQL